VWASRKKFIYLEGKKNKREMVGITSGTSAKKEMIGGRGRGKADEKGTTERNGGIESNLSSKKERMGEGRDCCQQATSPGTEKETEIGGLVLGFYIEREAGGKGKSGTKKLY